MKRLIILIVLIALWACSQGGSGEVSPNQAQEAEVVVTEDRAVYTGHLIDRQIAQVDGAGTVKRKMVYLSVTQNVWGAGVYVGLLSDELYDEMPEGDIRVVVDTGRQDRAFEVVSWNVCD